MRAFIEEYINSCEICQRNKSGHHKPYGLLQPLPVPEEVWKSLSMDYVVDLPRCQGFNAVLVVVCRLTKMVHFIQGKTTDTSRDLAKHFLHNIFRPHGLPNDIVSDRGPTFTSNWWKIFLEMLRIKPNLSTAFHPQSDGQTERVNQSLEAHLRHFCNDLQNDWVDLLPLAEFAHNSTYHSTIGMTPFFANYGYHPRMTMTSDDTPIPSLDERLNTIKRAHRMAQNSIRKANERFAYWANKHRQKDPNFRVGDQVWLLRRHIKTTRPSSKLDAKKLGPYRVIERIGQNAYRLDLPDTMRIHNVFNVSLLEKFVPNVHPERMAPPPRMEVVEEQEPQYEVESILDSRMKRGRLQYLVHWKGYSSDDDCWAWAEDLAEDDLLVVTYHTRHPEKPGRDRIRQ